jgi:peptidoglycan/xylan/chitin deacetylase (PgdA/CDA1 family)
MNATTARATRPASRLVYLLLALLGSSATLLVGVSHAAVPVANPAPAALVSFTFDDGDRSALTQAAPTLEKYGLTGTSYVIPACVGMTTVPNTCRADTGMSYLTWPEVTSLRDGYGWEIGSHSMDHACLASSAAEDPDSCQQARLTPAQVEAEMADSKAALAAKGINATAFAPPYGDYDNTVVAKAAKYYTSLRGFRERGSNQWPLNDLLLNNVPVQETVDTVASLKAEIDRAIAGRTWLVLSFHDIVVTPSRNPDDYQYGKAELDQVAAYVAAKQASGQLRSVNVSAGLVSGGTDKLTNGTFEAGLTGGWRTDAPATITADAGGNGSAPNPGKSIKLVSAATPTHLFAPVVRVSAGTTYLFKNFLNVQTLTSGEVAFYVDEYDAGGRWVSGQYRKRENSSFVEALNFTYTPSSSAVAGASLQVIVAGTGITAHLDNVQMLALGEETAPPAAVELVANGTFDAGLTGGWTTNAPATIVADSGSHGSPANPVNSVRLQATATNTHLFSPRVATTTPASYAITAHLAMTARTSGEVGFYVDEYDAAGNWVSGQYKLGVRATGVTAVSLTYSPSTAGVASASLQVIVTGGSGIAGYVDDVHWTKS